MNYINPLLSCFRVIFSFSIGLLFFLMWNQIESHADLIDEGKTDSAVKMLHFPKSLRVVENITAGLSDLHQVFNDPKQIRRTLLKVDPARIVPAKSGESFVGEITREKLKELTQIYSENVLFVFRRSYEPNPLSIKDNKIVKARHTGILYLAKQKKVLALQGYVKEEAFSGKESAKEQAEHLKQLDQAGLKALSLQAKKVLHSHKFEKRQSAY